jgi:galactose-6-phosphate isomerase
MKIAIGSDAKGFEMKQDLIAYFQSLGYPVRDETPEPDADFVDAAVRVSKAVRDQRADRGIIIDEYGIGSFMAANKHKGIICAHVCNEHSAEMTRRHNNANILAIGSGMVGKTLARKISRVFVEQEYDGGRHQIRVDMLNRQC